MKRGNKKTNKKSSNRKSTKKNNLNVPGGACELSQRLFVTMDKHKEVRKAAYF